MRKFRFLPFILLAFVVLTIPVATHAQVAVGISVRIGPPALPVYAQPICPGPRYIWVPGYWAYGDDGYFWVPGTWVFAPRPGFLWTPGYWGWAGGFYVWHVGYWGPHVGFYGGINYGFGYTGVGFWGGEWRGGEFFYNRAVTNVNVTVVRNVYVNKTVINNNVAVNRVSYNGGEGGIQARPTAEEMRSEREQHLQPTAEQTQHREAASRNRAMFASANHGHPEIAATPRAGDFNKKDVARAERNANQNNARENRNGERQMNRKQRNQRNRPQKDERRPHDERPRF